MGKGDVLSLRALEENDRVAKRISKRGCKSGRNFNPRLYSSPRVSSPVLCLLSQFRLVLSLARSKLRDLGDHVSCGPSFLRSSPVCQRYVFIYILYACICTHIYIGAMWKIFGYVTSVFILVRHGTRSRYIGKHAV